MAGRRAWTRWVRSGAPQRAVWASNTAGARGSPTAGSRPGIRCSSLSVISLHLRGTLGQLGEAAFEKAPLGPVVGEGAGPPEGVASLVDASEASQQLAPRGVQVAEVVEAELVD